ncbi:MAG: GntR family transcriptional regulator [Janthinobacterium lividum]
MKLQDHVCATLRDDILACRLRPGAELREQALATQLGVSKSPVREALLRLAQERLVTVRPRQGYHVATVSLAEAADLLELRRVLELACVRGTMARASQAQRESIVRAAADDDADFIAYNRNFHVRLAASCGNARLAQATASAITQTDRLVHLSLGMVQGRDPERLVAEHAALAASILASDARTATRLLRTHLEAAERRVLEALKQSSKAAASGLTAEETSSWTTQPSG